VPESETGISSATVFTSRETFKRLRKLTLLLFAALVISVPSSANARPSSPHPSWPSVMLWAWERPEDLRFIDPAKIGVAYLDQTIVIAHDDLVVLPRRQPLRVPEGTQILPVVRLEVRGAPTNSELEEKSADIVQLIRRSWRNNAEGVQIDFDARKSQRDFYRKLLSKLRAVLPRDKYLSITALASWCARDQWMQPLDVNEIVPMMFAMGPDRLDQHELQDARCLNSVGLSINERPVQTSAGRFYFFSEHAWRDEDVSVVKRTMQR
jgi:hypothetical protein